MAYFSIGDEFEKVSLMLHLTSEPEPADHGIGLDFRVNDIEAMVSALKEEGVLIVQNPNESEWGKEASIADPDGYKLRLSSK
ncbi:VOC family protein [Pradoshia eiseniae]|nr:VOC family protein [Pradoshia eiseniae]